MDPDQDLLDMLDRKEGLSTPFKLLLAAALAAIGALVAYFTLTMELNTGVEAATDAAIVIFIGAAGLLSILQFRLR